MKHLAFVTLIAVSQALHAQPSPTLHTMTNHPMQYYLSLPAGWTADKVWPVVVVLEAAEKEYLKNAERFVAARGSLPFIIVAPVNTNNGNQGRRDPTLFPYSAETWDFIDKVGDCAFNDDGIRHVIHDVATRYHGDSQVYITGFEAGAHALWSIVFNHPEWLRAAAPVAGNFKNRCVVAGHTSTHSARKTLPIHSFVGAADAYFGPNGNVYNQWTEVKSLALANGFENISETVLPGKGHEPLPSEVMNYFRALEKK